MTLQGGRGRGGGEGRGGEGRRGGGRGRRRGGEGRERGGRGEERGREREGRGGEGETSKATSEYAVYHTNPEEHMIEGHHILISIFIPHTQPKKWTQYIT